MEPTKKEAHRVVDNLFQIMYFVFTRVIIIIRRNNPSLGYAK